MERQGTLADAPLAGAHGHEMAHPGEPVGDTGALIGDLLEDSGPSVALDVVVALHPVDDRGLRPARPPYTLTRKGPIGPAPLAWLPRCARSLCLGFRCGRTRAAEELRFRRALSLHRASEALSVYPYQATTRLWPLKRVDEEPCARP